MRIFLRTVFLQIMLLSAIGISAQTCPSVFNPVVSDDGVTYLNACFAEAAGETFFTQGVGFSDCVDPGLMNPLRNCSDDYEPVVGCNGSVYRNACEAEKYGVKSFMPQGAYAMSNGDIETCFDYQRIASAFPTAFNYSNGRLTIDCGTTYQPVCGCNGIQYRNPCEAEASGVVDYSYGDCGSGACVDPTAINTGEPESCPVVYDPVCGCNDMIYINACAAEASGVQYQRGGCSVNAWQQKATAIAPGDMVDGLISAASGNSIQQYTGCTTTPLAGNENVYVIHKSEPGDLQVMLEILTPGADLDLFVMNGMTAPQCVGQSIAPPNQNYEAILVENAPIGTYYIIVDAQYQNISGAYNLQTAAGYLNSAEVVAVTCGSPMNTSNANGQNNIIAYPCMIQNPTAQNTRPGTGNEMVYSFKINQSGQVKIDLFNMSANMDMFLLDELDADNCIAFSQTAGNTPESITQNLAAGTYYVVVDGADGAVGNYFFNVSCPGACTLDADARAFNTECGDGTGEIEVNVNWGNSQYLYLLEGPVSGCGGSDGTDYVFRNLPSGMYDLHVLDMYGCLSSQQVPVYSGNSNFMMTAAPGAGQIFTNMEGGTTPYEVYLDGRLIENTTSPNYIITNVAAGQHEVEVMDATGCRQVQMITTAPLCGMSITAVPTAASCTSPGSISIDVTNGTPPFSATANGVTYGPFNATWFTIPNLAAGNYAITVTDAGGCMANASATVTNSGGNLAINATGSAATCTAPGSISVVVSNGTGAYTATLNGAPAGTYLTSPFTISNVNSGTYNLTVTDANGCSGSQSVTVSGSTGGVVIATATPSAQTCNAPGSIAVDLSGGASPYTVTLSGTAAGTYNATWFTIPNVGAGTYLMVVTDANGCTDQRPVTVANAGSGLTVTATGSGASCSSTGSVTVNVVGGTAPYTAALNGVPTGVTYPNSSFTITNVSPGTYTLVVTDANGCTGTSNLTVSGSTGSNLNLTATTTAASCNSQGAIQLDIAGGTAPFDVYLDGNFVTNTSNRWYIIQNVAAGNHTVRVVDANGCEDTIVKTVGNTGGTITVTATSTGAACGSTATISVDVTGGTAPYTVYLNGNSVGTTNLTWFTISNVSAGTYTLTVTDANGCSGSTQVVVPGGGSGNLNVTATTSSAGCGSTGSIQLDIAGGTAPFDVYVDGSLVTNTTNRWYIIQNLTAGTYTVRVVDANGCEDTIIKTVSGSGSNITVTATPSPASCGGYGSISVDVTGGTPPFTVTLNGNVVGNTNQTWFNLVNVPAGNYVLVVTDANGCTGSTNVTVPGGTANKLNVTAQTTSASCNSSGQAQLDITGGTAPFEIYLDGNLITTTTNRWYIIQNVSAGNHTVEVVDANGCSDTHKFTVSGTSSNLTATATSTSASCSSPGAIQLDINGGTAPFDIELNGNFVTTTTNRWYIIQNVPAGNHEIKITDNNGCSVTIWEVVGGTSGNLSATATSSPASCSSKGSIQLDINGGAAPFDIELDGNFVTNTTNRWYVIQNVSAGNHEIKITDKNGCSITIWENVSGGSNISLTTTAVSGTCSSPGAIQLDIIGGTPPFDIELNGNFVTNTTARWYEIQNVSAGTHTVTVTDKNGCTVSKNQTVQSSNGNLILTATSQPGTCSGGGKIMLDIQGGMGPFDVELDGNFVINTNNRWYTLTNVGSGSHTIVVTDKNGCTASTVEVVGGSNGFSLIPSVRNCGCGLNNGRIEITVSGGTGPFEIYFDGNLETTTNNRFYAWNNLAPGTYNIEVIDKTGCSRTLTETVGGSVGSAFTSTVTNASCGSNDGSIKINITSGQAPFEIWLDGNVITTINGTTYTYTGLAAGDYRVGVKDANGCESAEDVKVFGGSNITITANTTNASCSGNDGTIAVDIIDGTPPFEIYLDNNLVTTTTDRWYTITGLGQGTYEVKVVDKTGCYDITTEKVQGVGSPIGVDVTVKDSGCGQADGSIALTFISGDTPFSIYLDGTFITTTSDPTYTLTGLTPGNYEVKVEDKHGCSETFTRTIGGSAAISFTSSTTACGCGQSNGQITVDITGGDAPYDVYLDGNLIGSTLSNSFTATGLNPGTYDVRVVGKSGCDATNQVAVQSAAGVTLTTNSTACGCNGVTGTISTNITGGTAPYDVFLDGTYITTTFNSTYTIAGLAQGTYTVKIVDSNDCDASVTETVQHFADLAFNTVVKDAGCGTTTGAITVDVTTGTAPFSIYLNGNLVTTTNDATHTIDNLSAGSYVVRVSDANTCDKTQSVIIKGSSSNISINATAFPENCGAMDGNIAVDIVGGDPDFQIYLDGNLIATISDRWYDAMGLTPGTYVLRVVDRNGCEVSETLTVTANSMINVSTTATNSSCGNTNGTITVNSTGGLAPYTIFLNGNNVGTTFNQFFTVAGLAPGTHDLRVEDANGCFAELQETVGGGGNLAFTTSVTDESCGNLGTVKVNIQTGTAPFEIFVDGNLELTTSDNSVTLTDFFAGNYNIRVRDDAGCENSENITIGTAPKLDFAVNAMPDTCGGNGFAWVEIFSGTPPYTIEVDGNVVATTSDNSYTLDNLTSGGYIVKVTDAQGCFDEIVVMINNTNQQPSASFTYMFRPGGVVKFFSNNVNGNLLWDFDDGTTSTDLNPIHTFNIDSTYNVCLKATNTCGSTTFCEVLNIPTVYNSNLAFKVQDTDGRPGDVIEVPVKADNFDRVTRFQYSMSLADGLKARMVDVDEGSMNNFEYHIMNDETVTVSWESDNPEGTSFPNDYTVFTLKVELTGDRGDCTPIDFVTSPMTIQVMQKWFAEPTLVMPNFFAGNVCISDMVMVSGNIHREDQVAIPDVEVTYNSTHTIMSDPSTGDFMFDNVSQGNNCLILPTKDGDDYMALTVRDLIEMRGHILKTDLLNSPYKIIAADMNRDQLIDGNDLGMVCDLILNNEDDMSSGDSWRFIPSDFIFDDPRNPFASVFPVMIDLRNINEDQSDKDFTGIKLGDVDYSLNLSTMHDTDYKMSDNILFETEDQSVKEGQEFELNITSSNFYNIHGFQFELNFDPNQFEFVAMTPGTLIGLDHNMVGTELLHEGILPILWYDRDLIPNGVSRQDDEILYRLKFRAKSDMPTLEGLITMGTTSVHDLGVNAFDQNLDIAFSLGSHTSAVGEQEAASFKLFQNYPNPFNEQTIINFELAESQDVLLEVIDQSGKSVHVTEGFYPQGKQQIVVKGDDMPAPGIYFCRLTADGKTATNKLIFMR